jgi:hypothetical protein
MAGHLRAHLCCCCCCVCWVLACCDVTYEMGVTPSKSREPTERPAHVPVFQPREGEGDGGGVPDSKAGGVVGSREERAAAVAASFEAVGAASPGRYIPPPIQKIINEYALTPSTLWRVPCRSTLQLIRVCVCLRLWPAQCVPARYAG